MKPETKILARQSALTEEEWHKLFELRLNMIRPHLRDMSLKPIGDLTIIDDYFGNHSLKKDLPEVVGGEKFDLDTRGFFPSHVTSTDYLERDELRYAKTYEHKLWGYTRNNEWIIIKVHVTASLEPYKYHGRTERVACARNVAIYESSLEEILMFSQKTYQYFWEQLSIVIKKWAQDRKQFYEVAHRLELQVEHEERLLEYIPRK